MGLAKEVIPKFQPLSKHLWKTPNKNAKYQLLLRKKKKQKKKKKKKKKKNVKIKIHVYLGLNIITRFKFTANFDRCAMLIVQNSLNKNFESW